MSIDNRNAGFIVFNADVSRDSVAEIMHELTSVFYYHQWIDVHMRDAGGRTAISYIVELKSSHEEVHTRFHHSIVGWLKVELGTDDRDRPKGIDQWSMSNVLEVAA
jgi:hypothetical protein